MIRMLKDERWALAFAETFRDDPVFHDPMLLTPEMVRNNLVRPIRSPRTHCVFAVIRQSIWKGLFSFLALKEERYVEMLAGLCRDEGACEEMLCWLRSRFAGYEADFVFCPRNRLLAGLLERAAARFEPEQKKLTLRPNAAIPPPCSGIVLCSDPYREQYLAIHNDSGCYWTGERVLAAPQTFRALLAVERGRVAGYLDVTHCFAQNEIYDLFVLPAERRHGLEKTLLSETIRRNHPNGMTVLVDATNLQELALYQSMGFNAEPMGDQLSAHLCL